jgi:2'-5' RNA ligase
MRLFVALPLPPAVRENVAHIQTALRKDIGDSGVKWVAPQNIHLTLHFLGEVEEGQVPSIEAALGASCKPSLYFVLSVGHIACFPNTRRPRIIYLALNGDLESLQALQTRVSSAVAPFGAHREDKSFTPHLTLARIKNYDRRVVQTVGHFMEGYQPAPIEWPVHNVELMRSELTTRGANYSVLASVEL